MAWVMDVVMSPWEFNGGVVEYAMTSVWLIMHCLCTLVFTCGQVYSDVVVVVMNEVIACVANMVMH